MQFLSKLLIAGMVMLLLASCCASDWFNDDDNVLPGTHSEGSGSDT